MTEATEALARALSETAMRAAVARLHILGKTTADIDVAALVAALRRHCRARIDEALRDAKEALDANMNQVAILTARATMAQAGIDAVAEVVEAR